MGVSLGITRAKCGRSMVFEFVELCAGILLMKGLE